MQARRCRSPRRRSEPSGTPVQRAAPRIALGALLVLVLTACGGGGGVGGAPVQATVPPSNLTYATAPALYRTDDPITPNTPSADGDPITSWAVDPALPGGLTLHPTTGVVSGTPLAPSAAADYVVTAGNAGGETTTTLSIEVMWHESKSLAPKVNPTDADLRHFMDRTHFGFSEAHWNALQQAGLAAYVDAMTTFADTTQLETDARNLYIVDPDNDPNGDKPSTRDLARYWLYMIMLNPNPFQEVLAFKWHDHFAASTEGLGSSQTHYYVDHINLWRHGGAGNLRTLLLDMALDDAMLVWLDGISNRDGNVNENFGREWFELFTLGVDIEYTQTDIVEAARAFTGYRQRFDQQTGLNYIEFDWQRHDHGEKTILGQTIPAQASGVNETDDYAAVVDITLGVNQSGTGVSRVGQWIARSLLEYFCYADPPQNVIDELANDLRDGGWELKPVLVKMFLSEAFFSTKAREGIVKGPVEHVAGFMRATALVGDPATIDERLRLMGHRPTQPPTVDGWPGGTQWLSGQGMVDRTNLLHYLTVSSKGIQGSLGIDALSLLPAPNADSGAAVDALARRLNVTLSPSERTACTTFLDTMRSNGGAVSNDPFDPVGAPDIAEDRLRDLLWILGQHPTYMIR